MLEGGCTAGEGREGGREDGSGGEREGGGGREREREIFPPSIPLQVAKGLAYLHEYKIVYYDLKSPNVLVFQFPSPQQSLQQTSQQVHTATRVEYFTRVFVCAPA